LFFKFDPCITFFGYFRVVDRVVACEVYWLVLCPSGEAVPGGVNSNNRRGQMLGEISQNLQTAVFLKEFC
ncbi:MAG: hypothetical protein IJ523_04895, partial [Succinivibrionaceae bacterium]|nr:hypothetical protein [Succinivibrionaceae bacterium]